MEIAELILLLRNEVQRSYDLIEDSVADNGNTGVYINVERMEIEIPIQMTAIEKKVDVVALKKKSFNIQKFELPFNLSAIEKKGKSAFLENLNKPELIGNSIQIEVINQFDKKDPNLTTQNIGRIRLVLQPVVK